MNPVAAAALATFPELSVVSLTHDVCQDGKTIVAGTSGTIVFVYDNAQAYEVEFFDPVPAVVTLTADDLTQ